MPSGAVTVGGLVINLAAETSQLKTDMGEGARAVDAGAKAMINSMTGVTESSDRATDAGARMVRQLKEEIATFGMTSEQLMQYKANLNGVGGEVEALMGRLNQMKAAQSGFTDQLAASEAQATQRIRDMVAASMAEVTVLNDVAAATQSVTSAQAAAVSTGRSLAETLKLQELNMRGVAASMKAAQDGTVAMSADAQRILAQYDPLGAKLRALQSDMATLRKEMGNSVDPAAIKAFQGLENEIAKTQALMASAAAQANTLGGTTGQLTLTQTQLIERFKQQADTIGMSRSQMMAYQAAQAGVTAQTRDAIAAVKAHEDAIRAAAKAKEEERNQTSILGDAYKLLAAGYAALKVGEYIKDATMLAARYETLDVVMGVVGKTAGYTKIQMDAASEGVAKQGITMTESRNSVIKLVQAHIDLRNASALARIAQDAAVIGNINSSEAFERLVNGVARGNVLILRNIGINVNLQAAYSQMADSLGKSTRELTENERVQARLQAVLERGADIAGTYEAAMDTASKQITSMKRYSEDLKTTLGEVFTESLTIGVMALTDGLKDANGEVSELSKNDQLQEWGHGLTKLFVGLANEVGNAFTTFQKFDTWARHLDARKALNAQFDAQSKALSDYGNGMAEPGAPAKLQRIEAGRAAALAEEDADYVRIQAQLSGNFDRFERAADEREKARLEKKKAAAAERLKVDQDYAKAASDILLKAAGSGAAAQEAARKQVVALYDKTYVGTPQYRDSEGRESKPKVDQADNTRLQDHLERIRQVEAIDKQYFDFQMKLDDMHHKAGEMSDEEYYARRRANMDGMSKAELAMYDQQLGALRAHHNSTEAETAKTAKAINDILDKRRAAETKSLNEGYLSEEEERLRAKAQYDDIVKATVGAGATSIKSLDDQILKQREHNVEIGKTKEQIELTKKAQVELDTKQLQSDADYLRDGLAKWELDDKARAVYEIRLANLDGEIERRRTLAGLFDAGADREAIAKASAELDKYLDPTKAEKFGSSLKGALGTAARSMVDLTNAMEKYGAQQAANDKARAAAQLLLKGNDQQRAKGLEDLEKADRKNTQQQLGNYGAMASAAAGFFDEHSRGYQALMAVSQVFHAAELAMTMAELAPKAISAVLTQGQGDPYTAFGRMAAMGALVAGLGVAIGGIGGGGDTTAKDRQAAQGAGTVLGDSSAKSQSISRAVQLSAANSSTQIDYLSGMLASLRNIETGIGSFASQIVSGTDITNPKVGLNTNNGLGTTVAGLGLTAGGAAVGSMAGTGLTAFTSLAAVGGGIGIVAGALLGYLASKSSFVGKIATSIFGGKQSVEDSGFTMDKATLAAIAAGGAQANQYADVKTSGGWFHSDKRNTQLTSLGQDANVQFSLVIESLADSITEAGKLLGVSGAGFEAQLDSFVVDIGKVSLKGMTGEEIQKALESVFSKLGDQMASYAIGGLTQFQKVGEGYLETLVRVASDYAKVDASLQSIGKKFGAEGLASIQAREDLIAQMGGIDDFQSKTAGFASNFLTKAEQLAPVAKFVDEQMATLGLTGITTRDQFKQLVLGLDLTTAAGQKQYAALMSLQDAFAATHAATVDLSKTEQEIADERKDLQDQLDQVTMTQAQLAAKARNALAEVNRPLYDLVQTAQKLADTATSMEKFRDAAKSLNDSLLTGNLSVLTPEQQYAELRDQYQKTKAAALAGDTKAQDQVFNALNAWLTASQKLNSGDSQYQADFAMAQQDSAAMAAWASGQVDTAKAQLNAMNSQTAALNTVNTALETANKILTTISQNTAPVAGGANVLGTALSAMGTMLDTAIKGVQAEVASLRKDQNAQTGDQIGANAEGQQAIVDGLNKLATKSATKTVEKVTLE